MKLGRCRRLPHRANYCDGNGKSRHIGYFDTQEAAAHAVNAAIRRAGLEGKRKTNPVVDGQLVPRGAHEEGERPRAALQAPPPLDTTNNRTHLSRIAPAHSASAAASGRRTSKCEAPSTLTIVRGSKTVSTKLSKVAFEQKTSSVAWSSIFGTVEARAAAT